MRSFTQKIRELTVFAVCASILFVSRFSLQQIPGVQPLGLIIAALTLTYRWRALIPLYVYVMIEGVFCGFSLFWLLYMYVWLPLWLMFMLAGAMTKSFPIKAKVPIYMVLCGLYGLSFGILCAPFQAALFGLNFKSAILWIKAGIPFDITHGVNNLVLGALIIPLSELLKKLNKTSSL